MPNSDPIGAKPRPLRLHREVVGAFAMAMITKLDANAHKKSWRLLEYEYLLARLDEEWEELQEAFDGDASVEDIRGELVDVANMCCLISDFLTPEEERPHPEVPTPQPGDTWEDAEGSTWFIGSVKDGTVGLSGPGPCRGYRELPVSEMTAANGWKRVSEARPSKGGARG